MAWFSFRKTNKKTPPSWGKKLSHWILGHKHIDHEFIDELSRQLLMADVGTAVTQSIIQSLTHTAKSVSDPHALLEALKTHLIHILSPVAQPWSLPQKPSVILVLGVNGAGKTTSIAKMTHYFKHHNKSVILAAGDTFRAAAVEQITIWAQRTQTPIVAQKLGADSAAVIFDALQSAHAKQYDLVIADTAGRLHNHDQLMSELKKICRVLTKIDAQAPQEILLVLDASIGQNARQQVKQFHEALGVSGLIVTKLDGTAKGGVIFSITQEFNIPIRFIGTGEKITDFHVFQPESFVHGLFQ